MKKIVFLISFFVITFGNDFNEIKNSYYKSFNYEKMGNYKEAIKSLASLYKKYPKGYTLNLRMGWLSYLNKSYKDALYYYKKASLANSYAVDPKLGLIVVHLDTGNFKEAEKVANELLKIDFYNFYGNLYISKALFFQKKYDTALAVVRKMLSIYPTSIPFLEMLARVYKATNNKHFEQVIKDIIILDPNNVFVQNLK